MIFIQISDRLTTPQLFEEVQKVTGVGRWLELAAQEALTQAEGAKDADLTLVITGDDQIQELNRQFLGIDAPTDVLSFPSEEFDPDSGLRYLGDIILSYPRALAQAAGSEHPVQDELRLLVVHGVLHLLGYDHAEAAEKAEMWALQAEILKQLGGSITGPSE
jgi:probable rRNA maturation factor